MTIVVLSIATVSMTAVAVAGVVPSFQGLGDLPDGFFLSEANGVSEDGSVAVGQGASASGLEAFRWTASGGMVGLGNLPGHRFASTAFAISADGSTIVGVSAGDDPREAFLWISSGRMIGLSNLPGVTLNSIALGVSANGSTVVTQGARGKREPQSQWLHRKS